MLENPVLSSFEQRRPRWVVTIATTMAVLGLATATFAQAPPERPPPDPPPSEPTEPPQRPSAPTPPPGPALPPGTTSPEADDELGVTTEEAAEPAAEAAEPAAEPAEQTPPAKRLPELPLDEEEPEPPLIPPAADSLAGHFTLSPGAALAVPLGSFADGLGQTDVVGLGPAFSLEAAVGVSRTVAIGLWGQLASFGGSDDCSDCSAQSFAGGAFVRYHLVQGVRFDPWMSAGVGFRSTSLDGPTGEQSYSGVEWLRLAVGGDWYAFSLLGLGPFLELDMGVYNSRPDDGRDAAAHFQLLFGARITLDVPGK